MSTATAEEMPSSAPLFAATMSDMNDKPVDFARYRGKPLIVNFWARWCAPCRAEIPELSAIRKAHGGKLEVLGIGIEDNAAPVREFAKAYDMDYPVFIAREQGIPLMQALGNRKGGLPYTVVINGQGQVVQTRLGIMKKADLEAAALAALKSK